MMMVTTRKKMMLLVGEIMLVLESDRIKKHDKVINDYYDHLFMMTTFLNILFFFILKKQGQLLKSNDLNVNHKLKQANCHDEEIHTKTFKSQVKSISK